MIRVDMKDGSKLMLSDNPEALTIEIEGRTYTFDEIRAIVLFEPSVSVLDTTVMGRGEGGVPEPQEIVMMRFEDPSDLCIEVPYAAAAYKEIAAKMHVRNQIETATAIPAPRNGGA